jgi:hypothetical protein
MLSRFASPCVVSIEQPRYVSAVFIDIMYLDAYLPACTRAALDRDFMAYDGPIQFQYSICVSLGTGWRTLYLFLAGKER